jgi:hypothetical protein
VRRRRACVWVRARVCVRRLCERAPASAPPNLICPHSRAPATSAGTKPIAIPQIDCQPGLRRRRGAGRQRDNEMIYQTAAGARCFAECRPALANRINLISCSLAANLAALAGWWGRGRGRRQHQRKTVYQGEAIAAGRQSASAEFGRRSWSACSRAGHPARSLSDRGALAATSSAAGRQHDSYLSIVHTRHHLKTANRPRRGRRRPFAYAAAPSFAISELNARRLVAVGCDMRAAGRKCKKRAQRTLAGQSADSSRARVP